MTTTQATQYEKALARATKAGIAVAGKGKIKATGQRFIAVTSATSSTCHTVRIAGPDLICDCRAAQSSKYCCHRSIARQALEREAAAKVPAAPVASCETALPYRAPAGPRVTILPMGR